MMIGLAKYATAAVIAATAFTAGTASAVTPFEESFDTDAANWRDVDGNLATYVATGGSDGGGFITTTFDPSTFNDGDSAVLFRGQDEFGSSGGAFEGDYVSNGITEFSFFVRHNSITPLTFFTRISRPPNFPGAIAFEFAPVFANTWTEITVELDALNPQFVSFGGSDFASIFGDVGHIQPSISVTTAIAGSNTPITIDIDQVAIAPEPTSAALIGLGSLALLRRRAQIGVELRD